MSSGSTPCPPRIVLEDNAWVPLPTRIGRYAVRRRIGSGGFATVWLGYDESLDSPVAIKVLADNWTDDHHVKQRFVDEGRFLRKVESPHVVPVYDAGELDDGRPYLVMGYADQGTLADRLEVGGLARDEALEVVRQVGLGLSALHQQGVVHRDIKPGNVLFRTVEGPVDSGRETVEVRAMVGDLGLGKTVDMSSRLTVIAGTPTFVAPEQAQGERIDARADQYSLAALAYLLLTGRPPHRHATLAAAASPGEPAPMSTPEWPVPSAVEDVVRRGLEADRDERWPDVAAFTAALALAAGSAPGAVGAPRVLPIDPQRTQPGARPSPLTAPSVLADPTPPQGARRRRVLLGVAAVSVLVAGAVGGYAAWLGLDGSTTLSDSRSTLSVTVPDDWERDTATDGWQPPEADTTYPAMSVGSSADWENGGGEGVFVGVLPGSKLPRTVPGHPECGPPEDTIDDERDGDRSMTVYFTGCPSVTIERVVQVAANRLLWVQVRADRRSTAVAVLDSVTTHGL
jgi:eukaryotic-like serine/threonine-protein kinase